MVFPMGFQSNMAFAATLLLSLLSSTAAAPSAGLSPRKDTPSVRDDVIMFDAPAVLSEDGPTVVEMGAYVFHRQISLGPIDDAIASLFGDAGDKIKDAAKRLKLFASVGRSGKSVEVDIEGCGKVKLGPTSDVDKGLSLTNVTCSDKMSGTTSFTATSEASLRRKFTSLVYPSPIDGFGVISDIDDTIKISNVLDKSESAKTAMFEDTVPVNGMPELYRSLADSLDTPSFHYVSGAPFQLYPFVQPFIRSKFPPGPLFLRNLTLNDPKRLVEVLQDEEATLNFKEATIDRLHGLFSKKQFLMIGDSGEKDAETYGNLFRKYGETVVQCIWIRSIDGADNSEARFEKAFEGVPSTKTRIFTDNDIASLKDIDVKGGSC